MPFNITFLSASLPLTKTVEMLADGTIYKSSYPLVSAFTSDEVSVSDISGFYKTLVAKANHPSKPCLIKGNLSRELVCEPRKGATTTNAATQWVCLDFDKAPFTSAAEAMHSLGLGDVSHIVQYSSSYKLDKHDKTLSCHIFLILEKAVAAPQLKAWLMGLNQEVPALERGITLSPSEAALHWPLDISTCQNDKLLYVAQPTFKGLNSPIKPEDRIQLVIKPQPVLSSKRLELPSIEPLKKKAREKLNALRVGKNLSPLKIKTKMVGEYEVQAGVGEISAYEVIDCGEYVRLNLNGGDSQAYWHLRSDPTYLHNFKGEPSLLIKEVLPHYYADLVRNAKATDLAVSAQGDVLLAFRDKVTAAYWKGTWNEADQNLELYSVKSELQLDHFLQAHGQQLGAFIPEWHLTFDPKNPVVYNDVEKVINTFVPTPFMSGAKTCKKKTYPVIQQLLDSAVGTGEIQDHFINWLAVVWQQRRKPLTAWVLHGVEGTGKGALFHNVLRPLFGTKHAVQKRATELGSQFNGWLEQALVAFIDEIDADMFVNARAVEADLRTLITEPTASIRRMRTDSYEVPNYTAFIFSSNKKRPVAIPVGDRRFNIGQYQPHKLIISEDEIEKIETELEGFTHMLTHYKADFSRAKSILNTTDRQAVQRLSVTSIDSLAHVILSGNLMALWDEMPDEALMNEAGITDVTASAYATMVRRMSREEVSKITRDELALIFKFCCGSVPDGRHKQTAYFRHHGIEMTRIRFGNQRDFGIEVRWVLTAEERRQLTGELQKPITVRRIK